MIERVKCAVRTTEYNTELATAAGKMSENSKNRPACTTVYFDGACPICQREIAFYQSKVDGTQVTFVDVTLTSVSHLGEDLDRESALARLHVRRTDGALVSGAAAFAELWQTVPGFRWLGRLASVKPVTMILELGYRATLKVRPRLQAWFR